MIEAWVPTIVSGGALGLVYFGIRSQRKELKNEVDGVKEELKENYLETNDHTLLCENASLKINKHLTKELSGLKDDIFVRLRELEGTIREK